MFSGRTTTTVSAPASSPIDLNATRPTFRELAPLFGLTFLAIIPAAIGGVLLIVSFPKTEYDTSGWQLLGIILGALLAFGGGRFFVSLSLTIPRSVQRHYDRVDEWHEAVLSKFQDGDGQITAVQVSEWEYNPLDARKVAFALLAIYLSGAQSASIDKLQRDGLWVRVGNHAIPMLKFTQDGASAFLSLLAASGGIAGRGPRAAGEITFVDFRKVALTALRKTLDDPRALAGVMTQE